MNPIAKIAVLIGVRGIAGFWAVRKNEGPAAVATPVSVVAKNKTVSAAAGAQRLVDDKKTKAEVLNEQIESHFDRLHAALKEGDEGIRSTTMQKIKELIAQNPDAPEMLVEKLKAETDPKILFGVGKMILETEEPENQKLITDFSLNLLLSDDSSARRKASLEILANSRVLTPDLRQAVARVSREDVSSEIKQEAIVTMESWMNLRPDLRSEIGEELAAAATNSEQTNLSARQK